MDHFELFGLPVAYQIDRTQLLETFRKLQSQFHPDKVASGTEQDKRMAMQKSAQINDAYHVLKSDIARAEYLLTLQGVDIGSESQTMSDPEFLMQQMELREELSEIAFDDDVESSILDFSAKADKLYKVQHQALIDSITAQNWEAAAGDIRKLKFIQKLNQEIEQLEDRLLG